jgi:exonuclease I
LDADSQARIKMDVRAIKKNFAKLKAAKDWPATVLQALDIVEKGRQATFLDDAKEVDGKMYDGFFANTDKQAMQVVRNATVKTIADIHPVFKDARLTEMLPLYKARNFPRSLSDSERSQWEGFRKKRLLLDGGQNSRMAKYMQRLQDLAARPALTQNQQFLLEDLRLYAESIMPDY